MNITTYIRSDMHKITSNMSFHILQMLTLKMHKLFKWRIQTLLNTLFHLCIKWEVTFMSTNMHQKPIDWRYLIENKESYQITESSSLEDIQQQQQRKWVAHLTRIMR